MNLIVLRHHAMKHRAVVPYVVRLVGFLAESIDQDKGAGDIDNAGGIPAQ